MEDDWHMIWACPSNDDSRDLLARASREVQEWPCFWLRGLLPRQWLPEKPKWDERRWEAYGGYDPAEGFQPLGDDP